MTEISNSDKALALLNSSPYRLALTDGWNFTMQKTVLTATTKWVAYGSRLASCYPHYGESHPMNPQCRCVANTIEPMFPNGRTISCQNVYATGNPQHYDLWVGGINEYIMITSQYSSDFLDVGDAPRRHMRVVGEMITTGEEGTWASDGAVAEGVLVAYPMSHIEIVYERMFTAQAWANCAFTVRSLTNCVNASNWVCPYDGNTVFPAGQLLFNGVADESELRQVDGMPYPVVRASYQMTWIPYGIAGTPRRGTGGQIDYVQQVLDAIDTADFSYLYLSS